MSWFTVLVLMIFAHIIADYNLQGVLAKMKCKDSWRDDFKESPTESTRNDWAMALIMHSVGWSITIMLPIFVVSKGDPHWVAFVLLAVNSLFHFIVDDLKANERKINLVVDQSIHIIQVVLTWLIMFGVC